MDLHLTRDLRVLIVPGLHASGPAHWQTRWQTRHPFFECIEQLPASIIGGDQCGSRSAAPCAPEFAQGSV